MVSSIVPYYSHFTFRLWSAAQTLYRISDMHHPTSVFHFGIGERIQHSDFGGQGLSSSSVIYYLIA